MNLDRKKSAKWNGFAAKTQDPPGHPPSLIRVLAVGMEPTMTLSYPLTAQQRLRSDWANAKADLSRLVVHMPFVGFVLLWHIWSNKKHWVNREMSNIEPQTSCFVSKTVLYVHVTVLQNILG